MLLFCVPVLQHHNVPQIAYITVPSGYNMWTKEISKLELAGEKWFSHLAIGTNVILGKDNFVL